MKAIDVSELNATTNGSGASPAKEPTPRINATVIDAVQVILEAVIGSASLTVAELTKLKAGDALPLDAQLNSEVDLRLNGKTIARGELVAVGDNFAVRLTELAS